MLRTWHRIENPTAYARTALARTFISQRRRRSWSERPTAEVPERAERAGDPELRLSLQSALAELAPLDRAVLVLRFFEDRSVEQVALDLGKNASAITTRTVPSPRPPPRGPRRRRRPADRALTSEEHP